MDCPQARSADRLRGRSWRRPAPPHRPPSARQRRIAPDRRTVRNRGARLRLTRRDRRESRRSSGAGNREARFRSLHSRAAGRAPREPRRRRRRFGSNGQHKAACRCGGHRRHRHGRVRSGAARNGGRARRPSMRFRRRATVRRAGRSQYGRRAAARCPRRRPRRLPARAVARFAAQLLRARAHTWRAARLPWSRRSASVRDASAGTRQGAD